MDPNNPRSRSVTRATLLCSLVIALGALLLHARFSAVASPGQLCVRSQVLLALGQCIVALSLSRYLLGPKEYLHALGLAGPLGIGVGVGLVAVAPAVFLMFLIGAIDPSIPFWPTAVCGSLLPSIAQELFFRGMLFGFLYRVAGWSFVQAALLCGVVYSLTLDIEGLFAVELFWVMAFWGVLQTSWLSWLYAKWKWNLWIGIGIQVVFRLSWDLTSGGEDYFGGLFKHLHILVMMIWSIAFTAWRARDRRSTDQG